MGAKKAGRVPVGFFTADTPSRVIARAIIAAHTAAKELVQEDDRTERMDPNPKDREGEAEE